VIRHSTPRPVRRPFAAMAIVVALVVVAGAVAACSTSTAKLTGTTWQLSSVTEKVPAFQGVVPPEDQSRYTITFNEDGTAAIKADCNNVAATYKTEETNITIVPGPSTLAACPDDSLADKFVAGLSSATTFNVRPAGLTLYILNEGNLEFVAAK
jgi:heat shock protein HslJ